MGIYDLCATPDVVNILKIMLTGVMSFVIAFLITPIWTHFLYKYKLGIKIKKNSVQGDSLEYVSTLHADKSGTPTMGGLIVWVAVAARQLCHERLCVLLFVVGNMGCDLRLRLWLVVQPNGTSRHGC